MPTAAGRCQQQLGNWEGDMRRRLRETTWHASESANSSWETGKETRTHHQTHSSHEQHPCIGITQQPWPCRGEGLLCISGVEVQRIHANICCRKCAQGVLSTHNPPTNRRTRMERALKHIFCSLCCERDGYGEQWDGVHGLARMLTCVSVQASQA